MNKKSRTWKLIILAAVIALLLVPKVREILGNVIGIFASMDVNEVIELLRSFGPWAVVVSVLLMIFQSIAAPLPAFLLTFANAALWGWWKGAIISWSSAMLGALLCFAIARFAGRNAVEKLTSKFAMDSVDKYFDKYGKYTILICRLLPFISFDFVSYAAGLTSINLLAFLVATGIGQLPATIVYSYIGGMLTGSTKTVITALFILFSVIAMGTLFKKIYDDKHSEDENEEEQKKSLRKIRRKK